MSKNTANTASNAVVITDGQIKMKDGAPEYRRLRSFTRNNPDFPQYDGMREWFSFNIGDQRTYVLAKDVVFMTAILNTFIFVLVVAPVQGGLALCLALLINQKLKGINLFTKREQQARGEKDRKATPVR